jgi:phospholipid-transporting ATPase
MFVHGRECYRRNSMLILYMFYKNIMYVMPMFYYGPLSNFSGPEFYDADMYKVFNLFFTGLPIISYSVFDF